MVQAAHFGERHDGAFRRRVDASRRGRVFLEGEMGSRPVIVGNVSSHHATQVLLAQNDDVIQTLDQVLAKDGIAAWWKGLC